MVIESLLNWSSYKLNYNSIEINNKKITTHEWRKEKQKQKEHDNVTSFWVKSKVQLFYIKYLGSGSYDGSVKKKEYKQISILPWR